MAKSRSKSGKRSSLAVIRKRMEYFADLADEELKRGEEANREKIQSYLAAAQTSAVELAVYEFPKLQSTSVQAQVVSHVVRAPAMAKDSKSWWEQHVPADLKDGSVPAAPVLQGMISGPRDPVSPDDPSNFAVAVIDNRLFSLRPRD